MISEACAQGRHQGTHHPDPPPVPTRDQENSGRVVGGWVQPPCTGRVKDGLHYLNPACECPCHQPNTTTK